MSIFKKCAAAAIWTTTATVYVGVGLVKAVAEGAARKIGDGSYTSSSGRTFTGSDYRDFAGKCGKVLEGDKRGNVPKGDKRGEDEKGGILSGGFRAAKKLWNAD